MLSESLWKILSFVLAVVLMIIFPLLHLYEKQDQIVYYRVIDHANEFVSTVKYSGYVDADMWNEFCDKINSYGYAFEMQMTHKSAEDVPLYKDPKDFYSFEGDSRRVYILNSHQDIMDVLFPQNTASSLQRVYRMNTGDFIILDVKASAKSRADVLRNGFLKSDISNSFHIRFSGMVMN